MRVRAPARPLECAAHLASDRGLFFGAFFIGCVFLFATTAGLSRACLQRPPLVAARAHAGTNLAIMSSVPPVTRSFALGVSTVIMHGLGDVPSPTIIGALDDAVGDKKIVLLFVVAWLGWVVRGPAPWAAVLIMSRTGDRARRCSFGAQAGRWRSEE